jgi:hypothetical protein
MNPGLIRAVLVGIVGGFVSGLFGVGGGVLIVPGLVLVLGVEQRVAHGTSLAAMIPIALSGTFAYSLQGSIDWALALPLSVGSVVGARYGTLLLEVLSTAVLARILSVVLLLSALRLVVGSTTDSSNRADLTLGMVVALLVVGLASGALAGLMGVGGGAITIPAMVVLAHVAGSVARGTSLAVIVPTAVIATARNTRTGNARLGIAAAVGVGGTASAFLASAASIRVHEPISSYLLAGLLGCVAVRVALSASERTGEDRLALEHPADDSTTID